VAELEDRPRQGKEPVIRRRPRPAGVFGVRQGKDRHGLIRRVGDDTTDGAAMPASMDRRAGTRCPPIWFRARCASFSARRKSSRTRCAYYLERREAEFGRRWRRFVYLSRGPGPDKKPPPSRRRRKPCTPVAIVSYDEKPVSRPSLRQAPDLPPVPGGLKRTRETETQTKPRSPPPLSISATARSPCWQGSICSPGNGHALVRDRHRSREFVEFLSFDAATGQHAIKD